METAEGEEMKEIQLTQGRVALVDDDDYEYINSMKWFAHVDKRSKSLNYACRTVRVGKKITRIFMHHLVIGKPQKGLVTDHIDGNGLNNQKQNLRLVTHRINMQNNHKPNKSSNFLGVTKQGNRWMSQIRINKKYHYLGLYGTQQEAHDKYKSALMENDV